MSVNKIKTPVTKLARYTEIMRERKVLDDERDGIKQEFHVELVPGQEMIGKYSVKTEEHERKRLMSVNDATVALAASGYSNQQIAKILSTITVTSSARQFLVKYIPR